MEAIKGYVTTVQFVVPTDLTSARFQVFQNNVQIGVTANATILNGLATANVPYSATLNEGTLVVKMLFVYQAESIVLDQSVYVVTPYLDLYEVKTVWPDYTDDQARKMEKTVRYAIDGYCSQNFGIKTDTLVVNGSGDDFLHLPERLVELQGLKTLTTTLDITDSIITGDGWYLKKGWTSVNDYTATTNKYFSDTDGICMEQAEPGQPGYEQPDHGYVISAPSATATSTPWMKDYPFTITGRWGHERVPEAVRQAALLLVNDYGCNESIYRQRYLDSIKYSDTAFGVNELTWFATGNATADLLLSEYVIADWAVL